MLQVFFKTFVTFFFIYGIVEMLSKIYTMFKEGKNEKREIFIFIHVKNLEHTLEYIIRSTIFDYFMKYGGRTVPNIVVVDKGSNDRTEEICKKLCKDYEFLYYASEKEYLDFKNEIG